MSWIHKYSASAGVLAVLSKGKCLTPSQIADEIERLVGKPIQGKDRTAAIRQALKRLKEKGLVEERNGCYALTQEGYRVAREYGLQVSSQHSIGTTNSNVGFILFPWKGQEIEVYIPESLHALLEVDDELRAKVTAAIESVLKDTSREGPFWVKLQGDEVALYTIRDRLAIEVGRAVIGGGSTGTRGRITNVVPEGA